MGEDGLRAGDQLVAEVEGVDEADAAASGDDLLHRYLAAGKTMRTATAFATIGGLPRRCRQSAHAILRCRDPAASVRVEVEVGESRERSSATLR